MSYLYFFAICLLFGSNFYLMKLASTAFGPGAIGSSRLLSGGAVLAIIWWLTARHQAIPRGLIGAAVAIGVVSNSYPYALQPWLIRQGVEHSFLGMMVAFTPMAIMAFSIPVLGVWPTVRQVVGVVAGLGFLAMLMLDGHQRGYSVVLLMLMVTVPISYGLANSYLKKSLSSVAALPVTTIMLLAAGLTLLPLTVGGPMLRSAGLAGPTDPTEWTTAIVALAILGPLGTGLATWLWVRLVNLEGPLFAGMGTYVVPLVALMWGQFDGNTITGLQIGAIAGVLCMVALVQYNASAQEPKPPAPLPVADPANAPEELVCTASSR